MGCASSPGAGQALIAGRGCWQPGEGSRGHGELLHGAWSGAGPWSPGSLDWALLLQEVCALLGRVLLSHSSPVPSLALPECFWQQRNWKLLRAPRG